MRLNVRPPSWVFKFLTFSSRSTFGLFLAELPYDPHDMQKKQPPRIVETPLPAGDRESLARKTRGHDVDGGKPVGAHGQVFDATS